MRQPEFIEASASLRILEKRLLTTAGIERAIDAPDAAEALKILSQESGYDFSSLSRPEEYDPVLRDELKHLYELLYNISDDSPLVDIAASKYDYHNIKVALKRKYRERTPERPYSYVTRVSPDDIEAVVEGGSVEGFPVHLADAASAAESAFLETKNPQSIDLSLDRLLLSHMLSLAGTLGNEMITGYTQASVDYYNTKTFFRAKEMQKGVSFLSECLAEGGFVPISFYKEQYNKDFSSLATAFHYKHMGDAVKRGIESYERTGTFSLLERLFDNALIERARQSKYIAFGPENLFSYLVSKENEIRQIRILLTCKLNGIDPALLRERLRENYA